MTFRATCLLFAAACSVAVFAAQPARAAGIAPPEIIEVPAGDFIRGSDRAEREAAYQLDAAAYGHNKTREWQWYESEAARTTVALPAFKITRDLITNRLYARFVADTGHPPPDVSADVWAGYGLIHPYARTRRHAWKDGRPPKGREDHPVVLVNHADARAFADWLSVKTNKPWRLPTETEWEKAARGTDGRWFPWGNAYAPGLLNAHDQGPFDTVPVGSYADGRSPFGLNDAAGQVFEWTSTPAGKDRFYVKGGSWDDKGCGVCRPAARHTRPAHLKHILIGFRLVQDGG